MTQDLLKQYPFSSSNQKVVFFPYFIKHFFNALSNPMHGDYPQNTDINLFSRRSKSLSSLDAIKSPEELP